MNYIPSLTHSAGCVLTIADWEAIGVTHLSCDLGELLVKPGLSFLKTLGALKAYWNLSCALVVNLTSLKQNAKGECSIRSSYDGRTFTFKPVDVIALLQTLKPDYIVLPDYLKPLANEGFQALSSLKDACETNQPAVDALNGFMYSKGTESFYITDKEQATCFLVLHEGCGCPACSEGYTRAYFHHLYFYTPLLCHRWLIMHNQWMAQHNQLIPQAMAHTHQTS